MKFWDSSALVPLCLWEPETEKCRQWLEDDPEMLVWFLSVTEVYSAVHRKIRDGFISLSELPPIKQRISLLETSWSEVIQIEVVRQRSYRLLATHSLRAADALQLAAALVAFEDHPEGNVFVTFDRQLAEAAQREGFITFQ